MIGKWFGCVVCVLWSVMVFGQAEQPIWYTVETQRTLYSVAVEHGVTVAEIKTWNNLESNALKVGQRLIVGYETAIPPVDTIAVGLDYDEDTTAVVNIKDTFSADYDFDSTSVIVKTIDLPPVLDSCLLGKWESKLPCDIYFARSHYFEFNADQTGKYGVVICTNPYPQYVYTFSFETVSPLIQLNNQKKVFGGKDADPKVADELPYECTTGTLTIKGVPYLKSR